MRVQRETKYPRPHATASKGSRTAQTSHTDWSGRHMGTNRPVKVREPTTIHGNSPKFCVCVDVGVWMWVGVGQKPGEEEERLGPGQ